LVGRVLLCFPLYYLYYNIAQEKKKEKKEKAKREITIESKKDYEMLNYSPRQRNGVNHRFLVSDAEACVITLSVTLDRRKRES
jgi:hypothetical protein